MHYISEYQTGLYRLERSLNNFEHIEDDGLDEGPSNRNFGLTVGGILLAITGYRFFAAGIDGIGFITGTVGGALFILGLVAPSALTIPNRYWMGLGRLLFIVINPIIMMLMYSICIVPIALVMRLFGYDPLKRRFDASIRSYWVAKESNELESPMKNQF